LTGGKRQKVVRYQNQSGLLQHSIRRTQINPWLGLGPQGGSKITPRAKIAMRPKLAWSCWFDTMKGKSIRKTGTEMGEQRKEVCFWLVLSRGFPQQENPPGHQNSQLYLRHAPVVWHSSNTNLGPGEMSPHEVAKMLCPGLKYCGTLLKFLAFTSQGTGS
jgi:hypothetical protein